jgi:hypothetical protein
MLDGEKMAVLCREFDISRKTGYKIFNRYKGCGLEGLPDRNRRPYRQANKLPFQVEKLIVQLKQDVRVHRVRESLQGLRPAQPKSVTHVSGIKSLPKCPEWTHGGMVARAGIEPATRGFSVRCSTN